MTRILYWNLSQFSQRKVAAGGAGAAAVAAGERLNYIVNNVFAPVPPPAVAPVNVPDIVVFVELFGGIHEVGYFGTQVSASVRAGVIVLLNQLRLATNNNDWSVVPPICTGESGYREGVGFFYNSRNLRFDGPFVWGPDYRLQQTRLTSPTVRACRPQDTVRPAWGRAAWPNGPQPYPAVWAAEQPPVPGGVVPAARNTPIAWPAGVPGPGGGAAPAFVPETSAAPQWEFLDGGGRALSFPKYLQRAPQLVEFTENPGLANARKIKLLAVHTSPSDAAGAVQQIGNIAGWAALAPIGATDVSVILGDFNVDTINSIGTYVGIEAANFVMRINPRGGGGAMVNASRPYCQTHFLPLNNATPFNAINGAGAIAPDVTHNPPPALGYLGSTGRAGLRLWVPNDRGAIDNIFTLHAPGAAYGAAGAPAGPHTTVINTVVGSPYFPVAAPPGGIPAALGGHYQYLTSMANVLPPLGQRDYLPASAGFLATFRQRLNFGVIRDTSDHLPLIVDV